MGLAGRKVKQRIGADPRNLTWANDASKFGQSYLAKFGWDSTQGLGVAGDGRTSHIKVAQKLDMLGIGAAQQQDPNGIAWKQNKDFEQLLQRLNEDTTAQTPKSSDEVKPQQRSARHRPHRARAIAAKNTQSAVAISEILGQASAPTTQSVSQISNIQPDAQIQISTSTKSVADYFKERLQAKALTSQRPIEDDSDDDTPRVGLGSWKAPVLDEDVEKQDESNGAQKVKVKKRKKKEKDEHRRKKRRKSEDEDS